MSTRRLAAVPLIALSALLLTACTGPTLTDTRGNIATTAASALEAQVGVRPDIDCGQGSLELRNGLVVDCELLDPETGETFPAEVTIIGIDGASYSIGVEVGSEPLE